MEVHNLHPSKDRFPPSDDNLFSSGFTVKEIEDKPCYPFAKIWNIFCECCTGNKDGPF
jgi:hypothetical protein